MNYRICELESFSVIGQEIELTNSQKENIKIALLTLPGSETISVAKRLVLSGIKGILNFTSTPLNLPNYVYVEKYDIVTALEKVAYFAKHNDINEMK